MPDPRRAHCSRCDRHKSVCGPISWGGMCSDCACDRVARNLIALGTKRGLAFRRWQVATVAGCGGTMADTPPLREVG